MPTGTNPPALKPEQKLSAEVHLRDGRTLPIPATVLASRPSLSILSRRISNSTSAIALASPDDLPLGSQLTFFLKSRSSFQRSDRVEIASATDPALRTTLSVAAGSLVMQDSHTILATFDPLKTFGPSTFGPFHLRPVTADGTPGAWIPLATIVRLPALTNLTCPADPSANCTLAGNSLYLIDSISLDPGFTDPTKVPEGFVDASLSVPHPAALNQPATLYLRLRDDPRDLAAGHPRRPDGLLRRYRRPLAATGPNPSRRPQLRPPPRPYRPRPKLRFCCPSPLRRSSRLQRPRFLRASDRSYPRKNAGRWTGRSKLVESTPKGPEAIQAAPGCDSSHKGSRSPDRLPARQRAGSM